VSLDAYRALGVNDDRVGAVAWGQGEVVTFLEPGSFRTVKCCASDLFHVEFFSIDGERFHGPPDRVHALCWYDGDKAERLDDEDAGYCEIWFDGARVPDAIPAAWST
jgi:hypothetical protein